MVNNSTIISIFNDDQQSEDLPLVLRILLIVILLVTMVISLCGNIVVCYLVYRKPSMRSAINLLLSHIALSDIFLSLFVMPFSVTTLITRNWLMTSLFCRIVGFLQCYFISVGALVLLAISIDRYLIITKRKEKLNLSRSRKTLAIIWILCSLITLPPLIGLSDYKFEENYVICVIKATPRLLDILYVYSYTILTFYMPLIIMFSAFLCIMNTLRKNGIRVQQHPGMIRDNVLSNRHSTNSINSDSFQNLENCPSRRSSINGSNAPSVSVSNSSRNCFPGTRNRVSVDMGFKTRAYKTIFILSIVLAVCWTPFISLCLTGVFSDYPKPLTVTLLLCLGYLKSATNPIIYAVRIKKFRDACKDLIPNKLLLCGRYRHSERHPDHVCTYKIEERSSI